MPLARLILVAGLVLLLLTGTPTPLTAPNVHAANFQANPAPYSSVKPQISPPALLALARQQTQAMARLSVQGGGDNGNPLVQQLQPRKPVTSAAGPDRQVGGPSGPQGGINATPPGSILFNDDPTAMEQNETSVTVRQITTSSNDATSLLSPGLDRSRGNGPSGPDQVVGGVNDSRGFFYIPSLGCTPNPGLWCYPARNCVSLSGFSVSLDSGQSLAKSGCLPWANGTFQPYGDPSVDRDTAGNVYYGSLGFDQTPGSGRNGIIIERSTPALFSPAEPCRNVSGPPGDDNADPCWRGQVVSVGDTNPSATTGLCDPTFCTLADKDWIAVDRYSSTPYQGDVYVDWNSYSVAGPNTGTSQILLSRCHPDDSSPTGFASCTAPVAISNPADQFTGGGSYLTVTSDGYILASYINFGTPTTLYPIDYRIAVVAPGGQTVLGYINVAHLTQNGDSTTSPCLPNTDPPSSFTYGAPCKDNMGLDALAGVTMRAPEFIKLDVDRSLGFSRNIVYTTFELCTLPQFYPSYDSSGNILYPGNCPKTDVIVASTRLNLSGAALTSTPIQYTDVTRGAPGQQFFPSISVDERSGAALLTYNSTQTDPFQNMDSVYAQISVDGGASFRPLQSTLGGSITILPYQITKDPAGYFGQGAPACGPPPYVPNAAGCPGYAPENGDYLQGVAYFGRLYTHYTGTYTQKAFNPNAQTDLLTFFDGTLPMNQDDNFLNRTTYQTTNQP